ncbi:MAG: cyclic nucleotide-binding domain-containing protein [Planctomycetes bacterium]|nr:cyclic nucleotide-binding domain-containing protein [Planctomycetota bacterium]
MERPKRWDKTFASDLGLEMTDDDLDRLLKLDPFRKMDPKKFPGSSPLREILRNDARIMRYTPSKQKKDSEIVVRQGDYGSSAFLVLSGKVEVVIDAPAAKLGRTDQKKRTFMESFSQLWKNPNRPEVRDPAKYKTSGLENLKGAGGVHVFLNDAPVVIKNWGKAEMKAGAIFGEQSALGRVPRAASIVTVGDAELLEIRWQGLRDIMKNDQALKDYIYKAYRERTLMGALRATPIFRHLSDPDLVKVADQVQFETYGDFDWNKTYKKMAEESASVRLSKEPLIVEEGQYLNGLIIVRAGFTRVTEKFGSGERTLSYLGPGGIHGLDEIAHNWRKKQNVPWQHSLRSLGYVDVLVIPTSVIEQVVLPSLPPNLLPPPIVQHQATAKPAKAAAGPQIETDMLEFLVENRYINGTASMMIDIDRCTRCDDCVRACASTHNNNPRFIRHGRQHSHYMIANACMHCADPVCMIGCPTGAIHRSAIQGQVVINDQTCIGCATCANSCPYHNIRMIEIRDKSGNFILDEGSNMPIVKATKCDLCFDQLGGPACQRACPHDALKRVDMRDTGALAAWLNR